MGLKFGRNNILLVVLAFLCCVGYAREYTYIFQPATPIQDVNEIYQSTVWIHNITGSQTFAGTGWAISYNEDLGLTYISTAGHVVDHGLGALRVLYWSGAGDWKIAPAFPVHSTNREDGDIAIIAVPVKIAPLPVATRAEYKNGDEVLIAGVQTQAPPALVSIGYIKKFTDTKIFVDAWSWRGHSGGPLIHRKTNKVIGFVTQFGTEDTMHAGYTQCSNFRVVSKALQSAGVR